MFSLLWRRHDGNVTGASNNRKKLDPVYNETANGKTPQSVTLTLKNIVDKDGNGLKDTSVTIPAYSALGDALYQGGQPKEAFKAYKKALKLNPDYNPVFNNYAYFLSLEGKQLSKAAKMSLKTVQTEPDNATYLDTYGWILHLQGKDAEAKPYFKRAMTHGGKDNATILEHYADVLDALGEASLARAYRSSAQLKK